MNLHLPLTPDSVHSLVPTATSIDSSRSTRNVGWKFSGAQLAKVLLLLPAWPSFSQEHLVLVSWSRASPVSLCLPPDFIVPRTYNHLRALCKWPHSFPSRDLRRRRYRCHCQKALVERLPRRSVFCAMFGPCDWKSKCGSCKCVKAEVAPKVMPPSLCWSTAAD